MSRQLRSNLMILLATFIWGTAFLAQKNGGHIGAFTFNGIRFLIGGTFLLPVIYVLDRFRENHDDNGWNKMVFTGGIACGVVLILKPTPLQISYEVLIWWIVLISSALGLIVNLYTMIRIALYTHKEKKQAEQEMKEREQVIAAQSHAEADAQDTAGAQASDAMQTEADPQTVADAVPADDPDDSTL